MTVPAPDADFDRLPATPDYVLAVLRDQHRQACAFDPEADPDIDLTFDSAVADWRRACDLLEWRRLAAALNEGWRLDYSRDEWRAALEPAGERTLAGVCDLIAAGAARPVVRPVNVCGTSCAKAGAFLTVRGLLTDAGLPVAEADRIAPSTPLADYTVRFGNVFFDSVARLAPGALPAVRLDHPAYDAALGAIIVGAGCGLVGALSNLIPLMLAAACLLCGGYVVTYFGSRLGPAFGLRAVTFGDLRTFRDLAEAIAAGNRGEAPREPRP